MKTEITPKRCRLIFEIAPDLKKEFAAICKYQRTYMGDEVVRFIKAFVAADKIIIDRLKERYAGAKDGE
jgi:hypothetical protein